MTNEPKKKRQYRKSEKSAEKLEALNSAPTSTKLRSTFERAEAERAARVAAGQEVGAEAQGRERRTKAERKAMAQDADVRSPVEKVLCSVCEVSYPETETSEYLDPDTGEVRVRCRDCTPPIDAPQPASSPAPLAASALKGGDDLDEVDQLERKLEELASANTALLAEAASNKRQIVELERQLQQCQTLVAESREGVSQQVVSLEDAAVRLRDLEVLIGFEALQSPEAVAATAPWMLDLANRLILDAPEELDERSLLMLLVEAMGIAFSQRTSEVGRLMADITAAPAGEQLLGLEQAVRHLSTVQRTFPEWPYDEKAEALTNTWININRAAAEARTAVASEIERLMTLHHTELHTPPHVPRAGEGRTFQVRKKAPTPPVEPEPEPAVELASEPRPDDASDSSSWNDEDA